MAIIIGMCEWSPEMRGCQAKPQSFSLVAASPYIDFR
jgi:hypothetical protein